MAFSTSWELTVIVFFKIFEWFLTYCICVCGGVLAVDVYRPGGSYFQSTANRWRRHPV
jgi:hypothetical protein